ncbi:hypothetical protein SELMODRAFT_405538 [Selaginella moellendorffii]|uniref:Uncharacterized protein n=1 Tax=Selaginella moellendorffii TaxID=88036 RepID=D8QYX1_SELML|nr:hypothetical protein SELMODRAFT_405538 [Selaginella moellendorffii]
METRLIFQLLLLLLLLLAGEIHQEHVGASAASLVSSADEAGARHHRKLLQDFTVQLSQALEIPVVTTVVKGKSSPIHPAVNKESSSPIIPAVIKRRSSPIHPGPKHASEFENGSPPSINTKQAMRSGTPSNGKIVPGPPPTRNTFGGRLDSAPSSPINCVKQC